MSIVLLCKAVQLKAGGNRAYFKCLPDGPEDIRILFSEECSPVVGREYELLLKGVYPWKGEEKLYPCLTSFRELDAGGLLQQSDEPPCF